MSQRGRPTIRRRFFQTVHSRFRKKISFRVLESTISSKRLPVSTLKDAVHLSPNDDYYLVTDSEGNMGNMHFLHPIPEPQVTKLELLQENKNDIVGNKTLHCGKLMDMFKKFYKEHGQIKVITKLPNSEQSYKGKVKTHNYINRQNQSTTGKL